MTDDQSTDDQSTDDRSTADTFAPAGPGRWAVRIARRYPHPVERVWRAVSEPAHLSTWFPATVALDLEVGAEVRFGAPADGEPELTGVVTACEPPHVLAFTWATDEIRLELAPTGDGTELVLLHTFDDRAGAASFGAGWGECGLGLAAVLADAPLPEPTRALERHEALVRAFGLDAPAVDEVADDGRWRLVFERQVVAPSEVVADLLDVPAPDDPGAAEVRVVEGTGHGARIRVTVTGADPADRATARTLWHDRLEATAAAALAHEQAATP